MRKNVLAALVVLVLTVPAVALASDTASQADADKAGEVVELKTVDGTPVKAGESTAGKEVVEWERAECFKHIATVSSDVRDAEFKEVADVAAVGLSPVTAPAKLLSTPYRGFVIGWNAAGKIKSDAGRVAVRVVAAPLFLPAAILNIPHFLLLKAGLTPGY